jgi:hypothetical protein
VPQTPEITHPTSQPPVCKRWDSAFGSAWLRSNPRAIFQNSEGNKLASGVTIGRIRIIWACCPAPLQTGFGGQIYSRIYMGDHTGCTKNFCLCVTKRHYTVPMSHISYGPLTDSCFFGTHFLNAKRENKPSK